VLDQCGRLLRAALGFAGLPRPSHDRGLHALRTWLDSWTGIGHIVVGMERQGYDVSLTRYPQGWRCTPWRAVQHAAWKVLDGDQAGPSSDPWA
jgi:hypothetical protein